MREQKCFWPLLANFYYSSISFTLKEKIVIIMFSLYEKHDYHNFFLERECTIGFFILHPRPPPGPEQILLKNAPISPTRPQISSLVSNGPSRVSKQLNQTSNWPSQVLNHSFQIQPPRPQSNLAPPLITVPAGLKLAFSGLKFTTPGLSHRNNQFPLL